MNLPKAIVLCALFFLITPLTLAISIFSLVALNDKNTTSVLASHTGVQIYASLPEFVPSLSGSPGTADARPQIIRQYLKDYGSPLEQYAELIVKTADKYNLDFRLITAIAQQESNLCKHIPPGSYNCWGWGIHSRGTLGFESFEEGIETVSKGLRKHYLDKGFLTAEEIMSKYTPSSPGSWARGVNLFMSDME